MMKTAVIIVIMNWLQPYNFTDYAEACNVIEQVRPVVYPCDVNMFPLGIVVKHRIDAKKDLGIVTEDCSFCISIYGEARVRVAWSNGMEEYESPCVVEPK